MLAAGGGGRGRGRGGWPGQRRPWGPGQAAGEGRHQVGPRHPAGALHREGQRAGDGELDLLC